MRKFSGNLEVQEALLHFALIRHHFLISSPCRRTKLTYQIRTSCYRRWVTHLNITMPLEVEFRKTANIATPIHMNREFTKEIYNCWCTWWERVPQYERGQHDRHQLLYEDQDFHREQFSKLLMDLSPKIYHKKLLFIAQNGYLLAMEFVFPLVGHIMCVRNDFRHQQFWIKHPVVVGYHASHYRENRTENPKIKDDGAMWRYLKVKEEIGVYDCRKNKYRSERPCNEGNESIAITLGRNDPAIVFKQRTA